MALPEVPVRPPRQRLQSPVKEYSFTEGAVKREFSTKRGDVTHIGHPDVAPLDVRGPHWGAGDETHDGGSLLVWVWPYYPREFAPPSWWKGQQSTSPQAQVRPSPAVAQHVQALRWMKQATGLSWRLIGELHGVTRQAVHRWLGNKAISPAHLDRIMAVYDVLRRAQRR